jgi:hypothetical protein
MSIEQKRYWNAGRDYERELIAKKLKEFIPIYYEELSQDDERFKYPIEACIEIVSNLGKKEEE